MIMATSNDSRFARGAARAVLPSPEFIPFDDADVERSLALSINANPSLEP
jgi:hypothetical protein